MGKKFWDLVFIDEWSPNACWLWQGSVNGGYGSLNNKRAHRTSFNLFGGILTKEKPNVLHKCHEFGFPDNKLCVNPNHLKAGNAKENTADMIKTGTHNQGLHNKTKTHCPKGHRYINNTYNESKRRTCKICHRIEAKIWWHKNRATNVD